MFPYTKQWVDEADGKALAEAIKEPLIARGPHVVRFEAKVAEYVGARFAVSFNSGTSAMHAAYAAAGVGPNDTVVTSPNTFVGTVAGAIQLGARILFSDIDEKTGSLDLETLITPPTPSRGKLVYVPIHFGGAPLDMVKLEQCIVQPEAVIIEDGAHAFGAVYPDKRRVGCCAHSDMTLFSFHPAKTITTGEGGMITTNDETLYHRLIQWRNNGIGPDRLVHASSGNFHMNGLGAALGLSQLEKVPAILKKRRALARAYRKRLDGIEMLPDVPSCHNLFVVFVDKRDEVRARLEEAGIGTQVHYRPLYRHPIFKQRLDEQRMRSPGMERYYERALSLPLYYNLTEGNVKTIAQALLDTLG